jgi:hypothetical protein
VVTAREGLEGNEGGIVLEAQPQIGGRRNLREKQPRVLVLVGDALVPELLERCLGLR